MSEIFKPKEYVDIYHLLESGRWLRYPDAFEMLVDEYCLVIYLDSYTQRYIASCHIGSYDDNYWLGAIKKEKYHGDYNPEFIVVNNTHQRIYELAYWLELKLHNLINTKTVYRYKELL